MKPMMLVRSRPSLLAISFGGLLLLLVLAGALVYRWVNRVSEADRQQQKAFLEAAMRSFQGEFSGAVQEILSTFRPVPRVQAETAVESYLAEFYVQWRSTTKLPQLVGTFSIGTIGQDGAIEFLRFQPPSHEFETQPWPASLELFRDILKWRSQMPGNPPRFPPDGFALALSEDHPIIVLPLIVIAFPPRMPPGGLPPQSGPRLFRRPAQAPGMLHRPEPVPGPGSGRFPAMPPPAGSGRGNPPQAQLMGWCFLELDREFIQKQFLPALVQRHFGGAGLSSYRLAVVTGHPWRVLYQSSPALTPEALSSVDARLTLFGSQARFAPGFLNFNGPVAERRAGERALAFDLEKPPPPAVHPAGAPMADADSGSTAWQLVAKHESGSLDVVVTAARRRNLAIGFGLLVLLAGSMALLMLATQRARGLAQRQMEFVAGVSHELRTPVAVIQSAGFNLARGLVEDASRVRQYGTVIQTEGRRLSEMVEQILTYAGIQSGRQRYEFNPTQIAPVVDRALADYAAAFDEAGWQVEKEIEDDLPPVLADAPAIESAMKNLLQNALKYASDGKWLRISARAARNKKTTEVQVTVEDRGPGIDPVDRPHIFDPFYRGRKVVASSMPGAGLGLSLLQRHVHAHRGRVTVRTTQGQGTTFTLHLPALSNSENGDAV
jgi:signal transduction histidine kinase